MTIHDWSEFFVAAAGAAAALAGLIIVAMTVGVDQMIKIPGMVSRGATAIALLIAATIVGLAGLIPGQTATAMGIEVLVIGACALAFAVDSAVRVIHGRQGTSLFDAAVKSLIAVLPGVAYVVGAGILIAGSVTGLYAVALGIALSVVVAVINAWVMLVEIRR